MPAALGSPATLELLKSEGRSFVSTFVSRRPPQTAVTSAVLYTIAESRRGDWGGTHTLHTPGSSWTAVAEFGVYTRDRRLTERLITSVGPFAGPLCVERTRIRLFCLCEYLRAGYGGRRLPTGTHLDFCIIILCNVPACRNTEGRSKNEA